jgi:hypothetical protein
MRPLLRATEDEVVQLVADGGLVALETRAGAQVLPRFQFDNGQPLPRLRDISAILAPVTETAYTIASWLCSRQPLLEENTPAE